MYNLLKKTLVVVVGAFIIGCGGGGGGASTNPTVDNNQSSIVQGSISGTVTDTVANEKLSGVSVEITIGGVKKTATTDDKGAFKIDAIPVQEKVVVTLSKAGYVNGSKVVTVVKDFVSYFEVSMKPYETSATLDGATGGSVTTQNGAKVTIGANALVGEDGNPFTGSYTANLTYFDPTIWGQLNTFPGNFEGVQTSGDVVSIKSYGFIDISLFDSNNKKLQLASSKTADIEIPVPSMLQSDAPSTMPLWYYNEAEGKWVEKGTLTLVGTNYVGSVPHFSIWNADYPYDRSFVKGKITECLTGSPLQATVKFTGTNWGSQGISGTNGLYPSDASIQGIPVEASKQSVEMSVTAYTNSGVLTTVVFINTATKDGVLEKNVCLSLPDTSTSKYKLIQIAHLNHVDFSANSMSADYANQDAMAMGTTYMNYAADGTSNYILDLGAVELDSVTSVDTNGWRDTTYNPTIVVDHVYVAKTLDGYVKFKVLSISDDMMAGYIVSYQYSATSTF